MTQSEIEECRTSLERALEIDPKSLARDDELGSRYSFADAELPARRFQSLLAKVRPEIFDLLSRGKLAAIKKEADAFNQHIEAIRKFNPEGKTTNERDQLIRNIENAYDGAFDRIIDTISFGLSNTVDFSKVDMESRAAIQRANDETEKALDAIRKTQGEVESVLQIVREGAAEQGVAQQAHFFKAEAESFSSLAEKWRIYATLWTAGLGIAGLASIGLHEIDGLSPQNAYEAAQLISAKIIVLAAIGFGTVNAYRNYNNFQHNAIVNKHRQNALLTFKALTAAGESIESRETVLTFAAQAIYGPQDTGYNTKGSSGNVVNSVFEILPRNSTKLDDMS